MKGQGDQVTVLLVEDTEDNRFMMRRLLEMAGYRVVEAMKWRGRGKGGEG